MVSFMFLAFGILDFIAGVILTLSAATFMPEIAKYVGLILVGKGIWTIITSIVY